MISCVASIPYLALESTCHYRGDDQKLKKPFFRAFSVSAELGLAPELEKRDSLQQRSAPPAP